MSNSQVGTVYQQIINDVIEASRTDFEEGGVDEGVLDELKKGWQKKLTQQQLAIFPWDPKPEPPPAPAPVAQPPQVTAPVPPPQAVGNGAAYAQSHPPAQGLTMPTPGDQPQMEPHVKPEPGVKIEPGLENTPMPPQVGTQQTNVLANERARQQLQAQYGERASASINKMKEHSGGYPQGQPRNGQQAAPQQYAPQYQGNPQQQYRPNMATNPGQHQQRPSMPMPNGQRPNPSQTDGATDDEPSHAILLRQGREGQSTEMGRVEIDNLLYAQISARAKAMEGGGLMVPLKRAKKSNTKSHHRKPTGDAGPSRFDGMDDDDDDDHLKEEDDEDAINSDLDDPDDNIGSDDEDEDGGQIMLCMYDKVQRVKNKWKCVLKDGVLSINGKDYVFHKATGEYEW
ncbi:transcription factor IIA, alpha/beta subunit [Xylariomycetidae sp. FL2044]|nr:transcription factor IIA, alpha/beta subunit [Xylariomycetidae sp. FL2044]